jgi:hypothetical protein
MKVLKWLYDIGLFLSQPYPFYYKGKTLALITGFIFFGTLVFLYFFEPFIVYTPEHKMPYFWISFIHSCTPVVIITSLWLIKASPFQEETWNVQKEILLITAFLILVGLVQFLIRDLIYDNSENWSRKYLLEEIRNTLLIGSLFAILFTSLNFNRLNIRNVKKARELNAAPHPLKLTSNKIIQIETSVKSDAFELNIDSLLFAKAVGNYVEIYLKEASPGMVLKRITLKDISTVLSPFPNMIRTHRSYLVNLDFVQKVTGNAQGYKLQLSNCAEKIPVARNMIRTFDAIFTGK